MIKRLLAQHLKAILSELFENADAVFGSSLPTTASLFAVLCGTSVPEHPLVLKPDIFDIMMQPLRLVSGTVGRIALEGLPQAALGGSLTIRVENVYLLFGIQDNCDAGYAHLLKKLLLEMQPKLISDAVVRSLIHRLYGMTARHDVTDAQQRKRVVYASMKYIMRNLQVVIKNIHIRLETEGQLLAGSAPDQSPSPLSMRSASSSEVGLDTTSGSKGIGRGASNSGFSGPASTSACFAVGVTLPSLNFGPRDLVKDRATGGKAAAPSNAMNEGRPAAAGAVQTPEERGRNGSRAAALNQTPADNRRKSGANATPSVSHGATSAQTPSKRAADVISGNADSSAAPTAIPDGPNPTFHFKLLMKNLQLYADYNCDSYVQRGYGPEDLHHLFAAKWKSEVHTGVLMPFDVELSLALQLDDATSVFTPTVTVNIPQFHVACDPKQLEVIAIALDRMTRMTVRTKCLHQLTRSGVLTKGYPLPLHIQRTTASSGRHLLPQVHVCTGDGTVMLFPTDHSLQKLSSRFKGGNGTVAYLKDLLGSGWAKVMWRYVVQVVMHDVKAVMPLSRWHRLVELVWARKEYAFMYSKLLKPSRTMNEFAAISDPKTVDSLELVKIHMYEMVLPISTIQCFRVAAVALASASQVHARLNAIYAKCEEEIAAQKRSEQLARSRANLAAANAMTQQQQQQVARPSSQQTASRPGQTQNGGGRGAANSSYVSTDSGALSTPAKGGVSAGAGAANRSQQSTATMNPGTTVSRNTTDTTTDNASVSTASSAVVYDAALQQRVDEIRRLLKKVAWRDIVCLMTQLELLSEGDDDALAFMSSANSNVNGFAVGVSAAKSIICRSLFRIQGGFANRFSGRLGVPSAIRPSAEVREALRSKYLGPDAEARWGSIRCLETSYTGNYGGFDSGPTYTVGHQGHKHGRNPDMKSDADSDGDDDDVMSLSANIAFMLRGEVPQPAMWLDYEMWQRHLRTANKTRSDDAEDDIDRDARPIYTILSTMNFSLNGYIDAESAKFAAYLPTVNHESTHISAPLLPAMPQLRQATLATHNDNLVAGGTGGLKGDDKFRTPMKPNASGSGIAQISFVGDKGFGSPDSTVSNTTSRTSGTGISAVDKFGFGQFKAGMEKAGRLSSGLFNLGGGGNKQESSQHGSDTSFHSGIAASTANLLFSGFGGSSTANPGASASTSSSSGNTPSASSAVASFSCPYDLDEMDDLMDYVPLDISAQEMASVFRLNPSEADRRQVRVLLHLSVSSVTSFDIDQVLYSVHAKKSIGDKEAMDGSSRGVRSSTVESSMPLDVSQSGGNETVPSSGDRARRNKPIVLPNPFVRWILDKTITRMYLTQPTIELRIASIQLSMREPIVPPPSGQPRPRIEKRRTYLTIQLDNTELVVNASPSVPPVTAAKPSRKAGSSNVDNAKKGANKPPLPPKGKLTGIAGLSMGSSSKQVSTPAISPPPRGRAGSSAASPAEDTYDDVERLLSMPLTPAGPSSTDASSGAPGEDPHALATKDASDSPGGKKKSTASLIASRAASMGGSARMLDLSGLLVIIRVSIGGIRVNANIQSSEYQDVGTMGVAGQAVSAAALAALNHSHRRRSSTGGTGAGQFHTPLGGPADMPKPSDSLDAAFDPYKRAKEFQERQRNAWELDGSTSTITTTTTAAAAMNATKAEKRNSWTTDELLHAPPTAAPADGKQSAPANATNRGKTSSQSQPTIAPAGPMKTAGTIAIEEIPMCILSSKNYTKDSGVYNSNIGDRFLNACIILDIPERARSGGNMEAMDVQMGLGALDITAGRNELAVLASAENITLWYRVLRAVQRMISLQSVVGDDDYLLRDAATQHSHPMVLTSHIHLASVLDKHQESEAEGDDDSVSVRARSMLQIYRSRYHRFGKEELIRRNQDVLRYLNYSHWSSILAFAIPKTITMSLRTSEISAKLVSATIMNTIMTHWVNVLSEKALNAFYNAGLQSAESAGQFVRAQGIISTIKAAVEFSAATLSQRRSDWNLGGALSAVEADLDSVGGEHNDPSTRMRQRLGSSQASIGRDDRTVSSVQHAPQHQVTFSVPSLSFEIGKCPLNTTSDESVNATLTAKIFGISVSIPVNDLSLYQSLALLLSAKAPFYTAETLGLERTSGDAFLTPASLLAKASSAAHAVARTVYESAPLESNAPLPPSLIAEHSITFPVSSSIGLGPTQAVNLALSSSATKSLATPIKERKDARGTEIKGRASGKEVNSPVIETPVASPPPPPQLSVVVAEPPPQIAVRGSNLGGSASPWGQDATYRAPFRPSREATSNKPPADTSKTDVVKVPMGFDNFNPSGASKDLTPRDDGFWSLSSPKQQPVGQTGSDAFATTTVAPTTDFDWASEYGAALSAGAAAINRDKQSKPRSTSPASSSTSDNDFASKQVPSLTTISDFDAMFGASSADTGSVATTVDVTAEDELSDSEAIVATAKKYQSEHQQERMGVSNSSSTSSLATLSTINTAKMASGKDTSVPIEQQQPSMSIPSTSTTTAATTNAARSAKGTDATSASLAPSGGGVGSGVGFGTTMPRLAPSAPAAAVANHQHKWRPLDAAGFQVRSGPNYKRNKTKTASGKALFETIAVDVFRINGATPNIGARLDISELLRRCDAVTYASSSGTGSSISARSALPIPPLVIVQCMVPCESNGDGSANAAHSSGSNTSNSATTGSGMFGSLASKVAGASSGSPGWSIVIALAMTESTRLQVEDLSSASAAVRLFTKFVKRAADNDELRGQLKVICRSTNIDDLGLPSMVTSYNGTPVLLRKTTSIHRTSQYFEIDINAFQFSAVARHSIRSIVNRANQMVMQIAFVIEGNTDDELPECIFGSVEMHRPLDRLAVNLTDVAK